MSVRTVLLFRNYYMYSSGHSGSLHYPSIFHKPGKHLKQRGRLEAAPSQHFEAGLLLPRSEAMVWPFSQSAVRRGPHKGSVVTAGTDDADLFDVVIAGAGPAGATMAYFLRKADPTLP